MESLTVGLNPHPDSGCTDIDECSYSNYGLVANISYSYPTYRNFPWDEQSVALYIPDLCSSGSACVNIFYSSGVGFKCLPEGSTYAAVIISGESPWTKVVDVLKADLTRCDNYIPDYPYNVRYKRVRHANTHETSLRSGRNAREVPSDLWRLQGRTE